MELQQHIGHPHPLVFNEDRSNQSDDAFYCSGCEKEVSGLCFSCADCRFYLHKKCAEAPMQIDDHPFHRHHTLILSPIPSDLPGGKGTYCNLCYLRGKGFMYYCSSCEFYLHMSCVLLPHDTVGNFIETLHVAHPHPLILLGNDYSHLQHGSYCSGCSTPLGDAWYACLDCQFFLHKKCVELPIEITHPYHRKHQLVLEFCENGLICSLCETNHRGLFYCCSPCNVSIQIQCAFPPPIIEDTSHHEHPFTLLLRPNSSTCDACGIEGKNVSYICSTCNIQVHQKCISLPRIIGINLHHHPLYRNFFLCLQKHDSKTWDCQICFQKVNVEYGSYYCSKPYCNFQVHVNCVERNGYSYDLIKFENQDQAEKHYEMLALFYKNSKDCIIRIIKEINVGEDVLAVEILHISHGHNLTYSNESRDNKYCDGCVMPILSPFYYCSQCDFFLHKTCAELPRKTLLWYDIRPVTLHTNICSFYCTNCRHVCSGFFYKVDDDDDHNDDDDDDDDEFLILCLRCAALPHSFTYQAHEPHHLFFSNDEKYEGHRTCSGCGRNWGVNYRCKDCDFVLGECCLTLPRTAWHKCDKHSLTLAYMDYDNYPLHHYCDICEEKRDSKYWFYFCEICDTTAHLKCVLGDNPFIKLRSNYINKNHPHPLTFVQKMYYYPQCVKCGESCQDLSLRCEKHGCNYIVHWKCIKPSIASLFEECYFSIK